jgi:hypothetical protein
VTLTIVEVTIGPINGGNLGNRIFQARVAEMQRSRYRNPRACAGKAMGWIGSTIASGDVVGKP